MLEFRTRKQRALTPLNIYEKNLNETLNGFIYYLEVRCSFRVGGKVLLVAGFGQRIKVSLATLLSALVRAYMTLSLEPEQSGSFFILAGCPE